MPELTLGTKFEATGAREVVAAIQTIQGALGNIVQGAVKTSKSLKDLAKSAKDARVGIDSSGKQMTAYATEVKKAEAVGKRFADTFRKLARGAHKDSEQVKRIADTMHKVRKAVNDVKTTHSQYLDTLKKNTSAMKKNSDEYIAAVKHNKDLTGQKKRLGTLLNQEALYINAVSGKMQVGTKGVHQYAQGVMKAEDAIQKLQSPTTRLLNTNNKFRKVAEDLNRQIKKGNISFGKAQKELYKVQQQAKRTSNEVKGLSGVFSKLSKSAATLVSFGVAGAAIYKAAAATKAGVAAIVEYDQALHNLEAISYDATMSQAGMATNMSLLDEKIRSVAEGTKFSATEIAKGAQLLVQAGLSATEAIGAIEATSVLATGTLSDMATSTDLMTTAMRAFNLESEDSGRIADVMANAVNKSKLTIDKLRTSFNYVGATAHQAGLTLEETAATMMTLANSGIRASTIGTGMRQMLRRMIAPTVSTRKEMNKLGISMDELSPKTKNLAGEAQGWSAVVKNLAVHLTNADGKTINMVRAFNLFGLRGAQAAAVVAAGFNNKRYETAIDNVYRVGTASKMAAKQSEGLGVKIKNLVDRMKLLAIAVGDSGVGKVMGVFIDVLRSTFKMLARFTGTEFGKVITQIILMTTVISAATIAWIAFAKSTTAGWIKKVVADIILKTTAMWADTAATTAATGAQGLLIRSTKMLKLAFLALKASMPFILIASAIASLVIALVSLSGRNKRLLQEAREQVKTYTQNAQILENYSTTLKGLTEGSREYTSTLKRMLSENPTLEKSLRKVTGVVDVSTLSYDQLDKAMQKVHFEQMNKALAKQEEAIKRTREELEKFNLADGDESSMVFDSTGTDEYKQALDAVNQAEAERAKLLAQQIITGQKTTEQVKEHIQAVEGAGPAADKLQNSINQAIEASKIQSEAALNNFQSFVAGLPPQYQTFYNSLDNIRKADFAKVVENISKEQNAYAQKASVLGLSEKEMAATQRSIRDQTLAEFYASANKETQTADTTSKRKIAAYKMFDTSQKTMNKAFVTSVKQTWAVVYKAVKTNIDKAKAELERIKGEIDSLTSDMLANEARNASGLKEIRQSTMTDEQAYLDNRRIAQEQYHQAVQALAQATASGDKEAIEKAISSVKAAQDAAKELLGGVKDTDDNVVVSAQQAAAEVSKVWTDGNEAIKQAQEGMLGKMKSDYATAKEQLAGVEQKLKDVKQAIADLSKENVQINVKDVSDAIHQLHEDSNALTKAVEDEKKINVNDDDVIKAQGEVAKVGSELDKLDGKRVTTYVDVVKREKKAAGGIMGLSHGFKLPGYSRKDTIPALLTAGERVTNAFSTRVWDTVYPGFMHMMNKVKSVGEAVSLMGRVAPEKHAAGGTVGGGGYLDEKWKVFWNGKNITTSWREIGNSWSDKDKQSIAKFVLREASENPGYHTDEHIKGAEWVKNTIDFLDMKLDNVTKNGGSATFRELAAMTKTTKEENLRMLDIWEAERAKDPNYNGAAFNKGVSWLRQQMSSYIDEVRREKKAAGGFAGELIGAASKMKLAMGKILPGYGGGDKIDALLEPGEGIIPKQRVKQYGRGFIQSIINGTLVAPKYPVIKLAAGGVVDNNNRHARSTGSDGLLGVKDLGMMRLPVGGKSYSIISKPNILKDLEKALTREVSAGAM
jgi:TP901 family phage tail tape measure protein